MDGIGDASWAPRRSTTASDARVAVVIARNLIVAFRNASLEAVSTVETDAVLSIVAARDVAIFPRVLITQPERDVLG